MSETMDLFKKMVIEKGFPVHMETEFCKTYKDSHENCGGCESEDGCNRYCALASGNCGAMLYKPKSYEESVAMSKSVAEKMAKILDKSTLKEEVKQIV